MHGYCYRELAGGFQLSPDGIVGNGAHLEQDQPPACKTTGLDHADRGGRGKGIRLVGCGLEVKGGRFERARNLRHRLLSGQDWTGDSQLSQCHGICLGLNTHVELGLLRDLNEPPYHRELRFAQGRRKAALGQADQRIGARPAGGGFGLITWNLDCQDYLPCGRRDRLN